MSSFVDQYVAVCEELQTSEAEAQALWDRLKEQVAAAARWMDEHDNASAEDAYRATNAVGMTALARRILEERQPLTTVVVEAKTQTADTRLRDLLGKLGDTDTSLQYRWDPQTRRILLCGAGETHLDSVVDRLRKDLHDALVVGPLQAAYRERIARSVRAHGRIKRQTGLTGEFADVKVFFEPIREGGFEFVNEITRGEVPRQYIKPVEEGIREGLARASLTGGQVSGVRATLYDGSYHDVDSTESAFRKAGVDAAQNAARESGVILLEPIMEVHITVPVESVGSVMTDLTRRRGTIQGIDELGQELTIHAKAPLEEMLRYGAHLRAMTAGHGQWAMSFLAYENAPASVAERFMERGGESSPLGLV